MSITQEGLLLSVGSRHLSVEPTRVRGMLESGETRASLYTPRSVTAQSHEIESNEKECIPASRAVLDWYKLGLARCPGSIQTTGVAAQMLWHQQVTKSAYDIGVAFGKPQTKA